jgi:alkylation response protein AidB-like acyl-CoA dehydrogenase
MAGAAPIEDLRPDEDEILGILLPEVARFLGGVDGRAIDREGLIPSALRDELGRLGLFGLTIPAEFGGAGLSLHGACRVVAEVARFDRSIAIMLGLHAGLGTRGLVTLGAPSLRARWLPRLASGECVAAFGATEAEAGSALTAVRTTGRVSGDQLVLDGEKSYVTNGGFAGIFTVLARTPGLGGERAHSIVCVPADAEGLRRGAEEDKLGIRGSSTVTISFDGVRLPLDHILGTPGQGMEHAHALLAWGRTLMSAGCVGAARAALDATVAHVQTRRQFGSPIADFPATRAHVAWMAERLHAMEALVRSVGRAEASGRAIELDSTIAKVFCSEGAFEACDRALQLHGALGFLEETGVPRMLRDTRITRIFEGANDVLLLRIAAAALGGEADASLARVTERSPRVGHRAELVDLERALQVAVLETKLRWGVGAVRHQLAMQRLARAVICRRAARASLEPPRGDSVHAVHAAKTLVREGLEWLARFERAEQDERDTRRLSDAVYGG